MKVAFILSALIIGALGHGALVSPRPRNAIDFAETPDRCMCANNTLGCENGQACYWYNQGCFIGCPTCDSKSGRIQADLCGGGKVATLNDPELRTVNRNATAGSEYDIYKHNPWRAPGSAPVIDACGLAGGTPWPYNVTEWGDFVPTQYASHGAFGSRVLPPLDTGLSGKWEIGGTAEVVWNIRANHGGGYQYRLCPADEPLIEACFQANPLDFDEDKQEIVFANGTRQLIQGKFVNEGTIPPGSTWAMNPIPPRCLGADCGYSKPFCEPCPLPVAGRDCTTCDNTPDPSFPPPCDEGDDDGICSGNQGEGGKSVGVIDHVAVPANLKPGKYILGWRMDCESTAQVWTNCADVELYTPGNETTTEITQVTIEEEGWFMSMAHMLAPLVGALYFN